MMNHSQVQSFLDLQQLELQALEQLWDEVSTEHQTYIQQRYSQALKDKTIVDDDAELSLIEAYLSRYQQEGLVPAGDRWVKISASARPAFQFNPLATPAVEKSATSRRTSLIVLSVVGMGLLFLLILIPNVLARQADDLPIQSPTPTATVTFTPTPTMIPTVTPLALVDTDRFVQDSDRRRNRDYYPVVFRVIPKDDSPRVFVVQEKRVNTSEWDTDPNPDVASWVSGMVVHPVLGIPFSEANQHLFESIQPDTDLILRMNTGANLRFRVTSVSDIARDDTSVFAQTTPGIAIMLVGELDARGLPTETRRIVYGRYRVEQELDWLRTYAPIIPADQSGQLSDNLQLTITDTAITPEDDTHILSVSLDLFSTQTQTISFMTQLENAHGLSLFPTTGARPITATLMPDVPLSLSLDFDVPSVPEYAALVVTLTDSTRSTRFALNLPEVVLHPSVASLDLQIKSVRRTATSVEVDVRLYNPMDSVIRISPDDVWWMTGYTPNPIGPKQASFTFEPLSLQPDTARDIRWQFNWNGDDPYAALGLLGRQYTLTLKPEIES